MYYVGVGRRLLAAFVDGALVFFGFGFAIAAVTNNISYKPGGVEFHLEGLAAVALLALGFAYFVVLEALSGATLGKWLVGLRVRSLDGKPIGWRASVTRNLLRIVDVGFCCVGAVFICNSPQRQRLGDRCAGTVVTRVAPEPLPA
jgi:uncharacterized RDD family membrane protein YckC